VGLGETYLSSANHLLDRMDDGEDIDSVVLTDYLADGMSFLFFLIYCFAYIILMLALKYLRAASSLTKPDEVNIHLNRAVSVPYSITFFFFFEIGYFHYIHVAW
jgi:hypothetical protein